MAKIKPIADGKSWYSIHAREQVAEIFIYDEIGGWGITAKEFIDELNALDDSIQTIDLRINSPGGSVFEGNAIYNALKRHPATVNAHIDALAASMASVIALAGDSVTMAANGLYMIHNPRGAAWGEADELRKVADLIDKIRLLMVNIYAAKTGMEAELIAEFMNEETWFNAEEALKEGFIDAISDPIEAAAHFDLSAYRHAPGELPWAPADPPQSEDQQTNPGLEARKIRLAHLERSLRY